jgi:ribonuclease Z
MNSKLSLFIGFGLGILFCLVIITLLAFSPPPESSPVKALSEREVYYPGTEDLASDEMRVVALGTGMPNARPKQAAACWLVELGNGDKFLFDIGTGSAERLSAMKIPMDYVDKLFIGHLHSDHVGDFDALWIGGVIGNRVKPLRVWGPSGNGDKFGTKHYIENIKEAYHWDISGRTGNIDMRGAEIILTEFNYKGENEIIYNENDVVIRSFPAIHSLDGSVSYTLEWNGMKFAFSSDTYPNKWWMKYATNSDIAVHECFASPKTMIEKQKFLPGAALNVATQIHTSPGQFGKVMSTINPRLAVGYHFFNDFDTAPLVYEEVRKTYEGPLALAVDYMVFNLTKSDYKIRMAAIDEDIWPQASTIPKQQADPSEALSFTDYILGGRVNYSDVIKDYYDKINSEYKTKVAYPPGVD